MGRSRRGRLTMMDPAALTDPAELRPPGGAVLDLHTHSSERSLDAGATAAALVEQAANRGLDGICLTEHNSLWPQSDTARLSELFGITVVRGMELSTDVGHVLVYGLDRYHPELLEIEQLRPIVRAEGAAMVLAHPMRSHSGRQPPWPELSDWFEGIEAVNGDNSDSTDGYYVRQAADVNVAAVGGSDAHSRVAVGRAGTAFASTVANVDDLVDQLRAGTATAVDMRPSSPPTVAEQPR